MTTRPALPACGVHAVAIAAGGAFAAFYIFYTSAPILFQHAGLRVGIVMIIVVAVQPITLLAGPRTRHRRRTVVFALSSMSIGIAVLPAASTWPGSVLLGLGFGIFVVTTTAWVKELAPAGQIGRALGTYGFSSAAGGAIGAPVGVFLAQSSGLLAVAVTGSAISACALIPAWRARCATPFRLPEHSHPQESGSTSGVNDIAGCPGALNIGAINLTGHTIVVTGYALALSSAGDLTSGTRAWTGILTAFLIQVSLALGRMIGGTIMDRWPRVPVLFPALVLVLLAVVNGGLTTVVPVAIAASALAGLASGAGQTAALTAMMRRTRGSGATQRASASWNIAFDVGLGAGALLASQMRLT